MITTDLALDRLVMAGQELRFHVTATDPDGGVTSLALLNPPPGLVFDPVINVPSPATVEVRWIVSHVTGEEELLAFQARDADQPWRHGDFCLPIHIVGGNRGPIVVGDVTGDGVQDVIGVAQSADIGGVANTGAVYIWAGTSVPAGAPTATLTVPGAAISDLLASRFLELGDVTGDGVLDVVAGSPSADIGGVVDTGAIYVWKGGLSMSGAVSPTASLTVPGAVTGDGLTNPVSKLGDVTGDGILDIVSAAYLANVGGVSDTGAIYAWAGGAGLVGAVAPTATLRVSGAVASDRLAFQSLDALGHESPLLLADTSNDGILDVIACARFANVGGVTDTGAAYVWNGGAGLTGTISPTATLRVAGAITNDFLSLPSIHVADVISDGVLDVVVLASLADVSGVSNAGAIYVWKGGATLVGTLGATATLRVPGAIASDSLTGTNSSSKVLLVDVTDDGVIDIVAPASGANVAGVPDTGAAYMWAGSAALSGTVSPTATMTVPGAVASDTLSEASGFALQAADLDNDGVLDLLIGTTLADVGGVADAGAIYAWAGGAGLTGAVSPTATMRVPGALVGDSLGLVFSIGAGRQGIQVAEVTGDGVRDVIAGASWADFGGVLNTGAIYVWAGGAGFSGTLSPTATLSVPGAVSDDRLCYTNPLGLQLADLSNDGVLDIAASAGLADVGGVVDAGAIYVWNGGGSLSGAIAPTATLTIPGAVTSDALCSIGTLAQGVQFADLTQDGVLDVVAGSTSADVAGVTNAGAVYVWAGGALSGAVGPSATLTVPGAVTNDFLGTGANSQGILLADVGGDGIVDIVVGTTSADIGGVANTGAIYVFKGGALAGSVNPVSTLSVPGAIAGDNLGN